MNKKLGALSVLLFAFTSTAQAAPQIITFGLNGSSFFTTSPTEVMYMNAYTGELSNGGVEYYSIGGYRSAAEAASNEWVAFNWYEYSPSSFASSSGELFCLDSFWLAGAWGSQTLTITGYANGGAINTTTIGVTTTAQEYFFSGFEGIDTFTIAIGSDFSHDSSLDYYGQHWALGSVTVAAAAVPEPETWTLLLAGLGIVGAVTRRSRALRRF